MRFLIATAATLVLLLSSSMASAYQLTMSLKSGSLDPNGITVGQSFAYEVFLDTEGESAITLFSTSIVYDPLVIKYDPVNSYANDYYPLYAPAQGKGTVPTWLEPTFNPWTLWVNPAPGTQQILIDFIETNLGNTVATATNLKLGEIHFNAVGPGAFALQYGFLDTTSIFSVNQVPVENVLAFATLANGGAISVPEPGIAGLALGALGTAGLLAARRRRN